MGENSYNKDSWNLTSIFFPRNSLTVLSLWGEIHIIAEILCLHQIFGWISAFCCRRPLSSLVIAPRGCKLSVWGSLLEDLWDCRLTTLWASWIVDVVEPFCMSLLLCNINYKPTMPWGPHVFRRWSSQTNHLKIYTCHFLASNRTRTGFSARVMWLSVTAAHGAGGVVS